MVTNMLGKRIVSALLGIPALIFFVYKGGICFFILVLLLALLGLWEFYNIINKAGYKSMLYLLLLGGSIIPLAVFWKGIQIKFIIVAYLLLFFVSFLYRYPRYSPLDLSFSLLGVFYVAVGSSHLILLRNLNNGFWLISYVLIVVWSTDTGAYFTGNFIGKRKLAPHISPNKTWEGFVGGIVLSILSVYVMTHYVQSLEGSSLLIITPFVSIAGQLGDLFESTLKRFAKCKDSGNIIPGHGGILDRFDSLLWAAPLVYYLILV